MHAKLVSLALILTLTLFLDWVPSIFNRPFHFYKRVCISKVKFIKTKMKYEPRWADRALASSTKRQSYCFYSGLTHKCSTFETFPYRWYMSDFEQLLLVGPPGKRKCPLFLAQWAVYTLRDPLHFSVKH